MIKHLQYPLSFFINRFFLCRAHNKRKNLVARSKIKISSYTDLKSKNLLLQIPIIDWPSEFYNSATLQVRTRKRSRRFGKVSQHYPRFCLFSWMSQKISSQVRFSLPNKLGHHPLGAPLVRQSYFSRSAKCCISSTLILVVISKLPRSQCETISCRYAKFLFSSQNVTLIEHVKFELCILYSQIIQCKMDKRDLDEIIEIQARCHSSKPRSMNKRQPRYYLVRNLVSFRCFSR